MRSFSKAIPFGRYIFIPLLLLSSGHSQRLECNPCIDRTDYSIKAVVHGTIGDEKWKRMRSAAVQSANDMNVRFEMNLYDSHDSPFDEDQMIKDIRGAVRENPDALIVSMPSEAIREEVAGTLSRGVPIFGVNDGPEFAGIGEIVDFFGMDHKKAGEAAADEMIRIKKTVEKAIFLRFKDNSLTYSEQFEGFKAVDRKSTV